MQVVALSVGFVAELDQDRNSPSQGRSLKDLDSLHATSGRPNAYTYEIFTGSPQSLKKTLCLSRTDADA